MSAYVMWWVAIVAAAALAYATKLVGHLVPAKAIEHPRIRLVVGLITVALLGALTAVQAFTSGPDLVLDARVVAVAVAAVALAMRAPFLAVVILAAAVAAALRALGWG